LINLTYLCNRLSFHTRLKTPFVNKFSLVFLGGFLIIVLLHLHSPVFLHKLTGRSDNPKNLSRLKVTNPQRATATPCTTRTLTASHSFVDELHKGRLVSSNLGIEVESQRNVLRILNLNQKSLMQGFTLKGYATNYKAYHTSSQEGC